MKRKTQKGFTLIELIITVAIIGIMSAVAIPSYLDYVVRTNRADAKDMLTEVVYQLERYNTRKRVYTDDLEKLGFQGAGSKYFSKKKLYEITLAACGATPTTRIEKCAIATATPVAGKAQEDDGALTLDTRGNKEGKWEK